MVRSFGRGECQFLVRSFSLKKFYWCSSGNGSLKKHLLKAHKLFKQRDDDVQQPSLKTVLAKAPPQSEGVQFGTHRKLARLVVANNLPFKLVQAPELRGYVCFFAIFGNASVYLPMIILTTGCWIVLILMVSITCLATTFFTRCCYLNTTHTNTKCCS